MFETQERLELADWLVYAITGTCTLLLLVIGIVAVSSGLPRFDAGLLFAFDILLGIALLTSAFVIYTRNRIVT